MRLLRIVDCDERPSIGYVYEGMYRVCLGIKKLFNYNERLYKPFTDIIKQRWDQQLKKSIHSTAYRLNPCFQYDQENFCNKPNVIGGVMDVIDQKVLKGKLETMNEMKLFCDRLRSFGRELAYSAREVLQPDEWWRLHGYNAPHLQKLAILILSQTASSSGCERNWSVFERIHTKRRNRLEHQRLNDLVYVHYNLRLKNRFYNKKRIYDPIDYACIDETDFWVVDEDQPAELDVEELENLLYEEGNFDHTLFLKHRQSKVTTLIVYVDDMIITGDDAEEISKLQELLSTEFEMNNLGGLKYFLGIEVAKLLECKPMDTLIVQNHRLGEYSDQVSTDKVRYQRLVGKLIYLSHTRPDIAYAVSVVSQFMHNSSEDHMGVVIRILRYLKSSPGKGLMFSENVHLNIEGYMNADWAGNILDRNSTSGYFTFMGGNLVTWRSKKQKVVALSSAEVEFRDMAKGLCELLWLRSLLIEVDFPPSSTMNLLCDNKTAIDISHNPIQHNRTKHVGVDQHFIKQNLEEKII
ncbi:hypothetical protein AAG906_003545 [Vitis piasezkii]